MKTYQNKSGGAGIKGYENLQDGIRIQYNDGSTYLYNYKVNGQKQIEEMKKLADQGIGLTTYLQKYIKDEYAEKIN